MSFRRVALGGYPPRAPTDPYVGTLGHTVPQVTPSLRQRHDTATNPSIAIRRRFGNTLREFNASKRVARRRCGYSVPRFPSPGSSWVEFPGFLGTIKALRLPAVPPAALRCLRLAVPRERTALFVPPDAAAPNVGPGVGHPVSPSGLTSVETTGSLKFLGNPNFRLHMFLDPGRPLRPRPLRSAHMAPHRKNGKASSFSKISRLDIAWLSVSPPTFHSIGYPPPARLASRCWSDSPARAFHPLGSYKRFPTHVMFVFPLFQAYLTQFAALRRNSN